MIFQAPLKPLDDIQTIERYSNHWTMFKPLDDIQFGYNYFDTPQHHINLKHTDSIFNLRL